MRQQQLVYCGFYAKADFCFSVNCITAALRVLINLSNGNEEGCRLLGENNGLAVVFQIVATFCRLEDNLDDFQLGVMKDEPEEGCKQRIAKRNVCFDVQLLGLGLIINLVEKDPENRNRVRNIGNKSPLILICLPLQ